MRKNPSKFVEWLTWNRLLARRTADYKAGFAAGLAGRWEAENPYNSEALYSYGFSWGRSNHPQWVRWYIGWQEGHEQYFDRLMEGDRHDPAI